jgi:hypothetical protein
LDNREKWGHCEKKRWDAMLYRLDSHRVKSLMARGQVSWIDQILVLISHILHDFSANDTGELYAVCEYCKKVSEHKGSFASSRYS